MGAKKVADVRWCVVRILLKSKLDEKGQWMTVPYQHQIRFTEAGIERCLNAGEWVQLPSDGAIGELVEEVPDEQSANELLLKMARDRPGEEFRVCMGVGVS